METDSEKMKARIRRKKEEAKSKEGKEEKEGKRNRERKDGRHMWGGGIPNPPAAQLLLPLCLCIGCFTIQTRVTTLRNEALL